MTGSSIAPIRRVRLFHWNAEEAKLLIDQLRACGYEVDFPSDKVLERGFRSLREAPPHAIVIDLTRLPSQGRHVAVAIRSQKSIRRIPIVFVDGDPKKVERIRSTLPDAVYTSRSSVGSALKRLKPLDNPVSPRISDRTTAQKLGIREGSAAAVIDPPREYAKAVGTLPEGASLEEAPATVLPVTLWFIREVEQYLRALPRMREIARRSRLWIIYPKSTARRRASGEISLLLIREEAARLGLVHYKTCALDSTWTGMLLALKT